MIQVKPVFDIWNMQNPIGYQSNVVILIKNHGKGNVYFIKMQLPRLSWEDLGRVPMWDKGITTNELKFSKIWTFFSVIHNQIWML